MKWWGEAQWDCIFQILILIHFFIQEPPKSWRFFFLPEFSTFQFNLSYAPVSKTPSVNDIRFKTFVLKHCLLFQNKSLLPSPLWASEMGGERMRQNYLYASYAPNEIILFATNLLPTHHILMCHHIKKWKMGFFSIKLSYTESFPVDFWHFLY